MTRKTKVAEAKAGAGWWDTRFRSQECSSFPQKEPGNPLPRSLVLQTWFHAHHQKPHWSDRIQREAANPSEGTRRPLQNSMLLQRRTAMG